MRADASIDSPSPADQEQQFRDLANAIPNLAWIADADGYIYWYNDRWYEYTGTTPEQMKGWRWQSVHDPALLPEVMDKWKASIRTGSPFEMLFPLRGRDGKYRSFLTRIVPVRDESGKITRWFGTNTDVDELRRTRDALARSESRLRQHEEMLRLTRTAAKIAPWEYNVQEETYEWSDEVYALFGGVRLGRTQSEFLSVMGYSNDRRSAIHALETALKRKQDYEFQFRFVKPDGEVRLIAARGRPFYNQGRDLVLGMFIDITPLSTSSSGATSKTRKRRSRKSKA